MFNGKKKIAGGLLPQTFLDRTSQCLGGTFSVLCDKMTWVIAVLQSSLFLQNIAIQSAMMESLMPHAPTQIQVGLGDLLVMNNMRQK